MKMGRLRRIKEMLLLLVVLSLSDCIAAQNGDYYLGKTKYPFILYDSNEFKFPSDEFLYEEINKKYDQMILEGNGKLRIIHIGGSHIQADIYTHLLRKRMQTSQLGLNGGRGFLYPYRIAKTNSPSNYKVRYTGIWESCKNTQSNPFCNLGLGGYASVTKSENASVKIYLNTDSTISYTYNRLKVFHEPTIYNLKVITADSAYSPVSYNELGYSDFVFDSEMDSMLLQISLPADTTGSFVLQGFSFDNDNPGVVYNAIGVNGARLDSYLKCELYADHMKALEPDLVIFSIGTNDAYTRHFNETKYRTDYIELINRTREAIPGVSILLTVPNDSYLYRKYVNKNTAKMEKIIYELAKEYHCAVWDFYKIMGGFNSAQIWYNYKLMKYDRVHFNRQGYLLKGDLLFSAFLKNWEKDLEKRYSERQLPPNIPVAKNEN